LAIPLAQDASSPHKPSRGDAPEPYITLESELRCLALYPSVPFIPRRTRSTPRSTSANGPSAASQRNQRFMFQGFWPARESRGSGGTRRSLPGATPAPRTKADPCACRLVECAKTSARHSRPDLEPQELALSSCSALLAAHSVTAAARRECSRADPTPDPLVSPANEAHCLSPPRVDSTRLHAPRTRRRRRSAMDAAVPRCVFRVERSCGDPRPPDQTHLAVPVKPASTGRDPGADEADRNGSTWAFPAGDPA